MTAAFDTAYAHWPKKTERKQALERFQVAARRRPLVELVADIIRFGDAYAATTETQFVPALGVWIGRERWDDDLPRPRINPGPSRRPTRDEENLAVVARLAAREQAEQRGIAG